MALTDNKKKIVTQIGAQLLRALEAIARTAVTQLAATSPQAPTGVFATSQNPMVGGRSAEQQVSTIYYQEQTHLKRLIREPFVARLLVRWEDETPVREETLYVTRASAAGMSSSIPNAKIATYTAPLGRLAEFGAGESVVIVVDRRERVALIEERVRVRPELQDGDWDALDNSFEFTEWRVALESLRRFLEEVGRAPSRARETVPDILGALIEEGAQAALVREVLKRKVIARIELRDQPILDRYQGEVFRLPLDRRLLLLGPPGTGKTTTLIRRLAQKRTPGALTEDEEVLLRSTGLRESFVQADSWAMFSPTELLKLYLRDAFNREGVPAAAENLRTWEKERLALGRHVFGILRSAESGRFQLDEDLDTLLDSSSYGLRDLYEEFTGHCESVVLERCTDALRQLESCDILSVRSRASELVRRLGVRGGLTLRNVAGLLDRASEIQPDLRQLEGETDSALRQSGNRLLNRHPDLLPTLVEALPRLVGGGRREDEEEEEAEENEEGEEGWRTVDRRGGGERKRLAAEMLVAALRQRARALAMERSEVGGRAGRVIAFLGDRLPGDEELAEVGTRVVTLTHLRTLLRAPRMYVMGPPGIYSRFRRNAHKDGRLFRPEADDAIKQGRISADEADVLILTMLRNARRLLEETGWRGPSSGPQKWLDGIQSRYLMQVFVDEATDLSAVQLACTMELTHPRLRCWFACGDFEQRITTRGIQDSSEIEWLGHTIGNSVEVRKVDIAYRQSRRLRELATALSQEGASGVTMRAPEQGEYTDVWPLLAEGMAGDPLARWLSERISEVEGMVGSLPSIAIFVEGDSHIHNLVEKLRPLLGERNILVVGSKDGRVVGDNLEVRVFDVRHIKGLEFEAVFFVGIDRLAARLPALFDRFFYVGVSRAATYLGVTCEGRLPAGLERVRGHFASGGWQS